MSFRDSVVPGDDDSSSSPKEFHPLRDLIDNVRNNHIRRKEMRHERRMARRQGEMTDDEIQQGNTNKQRGDKPAANVTPLVPYKPGVPFLPGKPSDYNVSNAAKEAVPFSVMRDIGTQGLPEKNIPSPVPRQVSQLEPPLAEAKDAPAGQGQGQREQWKFADFKREREMNENKVAEPITVKEHNGAVTQIQDNNTSANDRLNAYLTARGRAVSELDLNGTGVNDDGLAILSKAPNLTKLMLNDTEVNDDSMRVLGRQGLRNLQELNLHSTKVGDEGVAQLKKLPLKSLNLSDTTVSEECLQHLKDMKTLQVLNLEYSGIHNEGIKTLKDMPNVRSLSLKGCPITDDVVADLAKCQQLMLLNLEDTQITPQKVAWLQKNMPRCVIIPPDGAGATEGHAPHRHRFQELLRPRR